MGSGIYNLQSRSIRATTDGYHSKSVDEIFTQQKEKKIHNEMDPKNFKIREARDSDDHPNTIPIILALDVTGSMGHIPHDLIKDGLPKMMSSLIQHGAKDATLCFIAVGDHVHDKFPLQAGQFESADEPLDMWLTRTYLEKGGGPNEGESYLLAWYFASHMTSIDSVEKRGEKGFLFTIGDEPNLAVLPKSAVEAITGQPIQSNLLSSALLTAAQEKYHVYHLEVTRNDENGRSFARRQWKEVLGQNCVFVDDYTKVPEVITEIVVRHSSIDPSEHRIPVDDEQEEKSEQEIIL